MGDTYERVAVNLRPARAEMLAGSRAIIEATLAGDVLIGRCAFNLHERYEIEIDFPIKTMNANERKWICQTDAGPVLFPDMSADCRARIDSFHLAYVAFNRADYAEFLLQAPTPLSDDISVNHYSRILQMPTQNTVFRARYGRGE